MIDLLAGIWNFLLFKSFLSPYALLVFYWLGAIGAPFLAWRLAVAVKIHFFLPRFPQGGMDETPDRKAPGRKLRGRLLRSAALFFLVLELFWRMFFEFLFAYLQMHDALLQLVGG